MYDNFLDAREILDGEAFEADLCIIGAGAAGITLAREFAGTNVRVCCLEAGGLSIDPQVNALSDVQEGDARFYDANNLRLRQYGGSTNHWEGKCLPYEPEDFERKDWIDGSGWPIGYGDVEPYYQRAHEVLGLGPFAYDAAAVAEDLGRATDPFDRAVLGLAMTRRNPVRFGLAFGDELNAAENVRTILYADVSDLRLAEDTGTRMDHAEVRSLSGNSFRVRARYFVLAAGGIENARQLLMANSQRPAGLGNHSGHVGRYFQDHLRYFSGMITGVGDVAAMRFYTGDNRHAGHLVQAHLTPPPDVCDAHRMSRVRLTLSSMNAAYDKLRDLKSDGINPSDIVSLLANPYDTAHALRCRHLSTPGIYTLYNYAEQVPNPDSRVELSRQTDPIGRPQAQLSWKLSRLDHDSVYAAQKMLATEVGRTGFGRMRIEMPEEPEVYLEDCSGGGHEIGTTRMAATPGEGVTDPDGRVFHTDNFYIAGSSIFPTSSYVNPTLTIIAMTLRLADHLKAGFRKEDVI